MAGVAEAAVLTLATVLASEPVPSENQCPKEPAPVAVAASARPVSPALALPGPAGVSPKAPKAQSPKPPAAKPPEPRVFGPRFERHAPAAPMPPTMAQLVLATPARVSASASAASPLVSAPNPVLAAQLVSAAPEAAHTPAVSTAPAQPSCNAAPKAWRVRLQLTQPALEVVVLTASPYALQQKVQVYYEASEGRATLFSKTGPAARP